MTSVESRAGGALTLSERQWLATRRQLVERRYELGRSAVDLYPAVERLAGKPLLTRPEWSPAEPILLDAIDLELRPDAAAGGITGTEPVAGSVVPTCADGSRYPSYSAAMAALAAPRVFDNRGTYRLLDADLSGPRGRLVFGRGRYFDGIDTGEACAHEYVATGNAGPLRAAIGDPCDPARRPTSVAITTLTLRYDRPSGSASYLLHWRDPAKVGHAGGLYQVLPVGVFQPAGDQPQHECNDFDLWRSMVREYAEELLGEPERHGPDPIDYDAWPFAARMTRALGGDIRAYCLGLGVDPLTLATDLLTCVVIDAQLFDELFDTLATTNDEGSLVANGTETRHPFSQASVEHFAGNEPMQAAGAALLTSAFAHRRTLLD